jgi:hypothetical protein
VFVIFKGHKKSLSALRVLHDVTQFVILLAAPLSVVIGRLLCPLLTLYYTAFRSAATRPPPAGILLACGSLRACGLRLSVLPLLRYGNLNKESLV